MADETWEKGEDHDDASPWIEVETEDAAFQIAVSMWGPIDVAKERAFRDRIIADHAKALQVDALVKALERQLKHWDESFGECNETCTAENCGRKDAVEALESFRQAGAG